MEAQKDKMNLLAEERNKLAKERNQLAAERTLTAWIRTSLASVGGGFAILRLLEFQEYSHRVIADLVGELLILLGIFILAFSLIDYKKRVDELKIMHSHRHNIWLVITVITLMVVSSLLFFVAVR